MKLSTPVESIYVAVSCPPGGAWVETSICRWFLSVPSGRAPPGARGLKLRQLGKRVGSVRSCPPGGAWVETLSRKKKAKRRPGRAPPGARGLKRRR